MYLQLPGALDPPDAHSPIHTLTRSWDDVDHALGNASLQGQLCKLQGCEWGHLRRQERRLGQKGLGRGALPSFPSSLGSRQGGAAVAGRPLGEAMFMPHHTGTTSQLPSCSSWEPRTGLANLRYLSSTFSWQGFSPSARPGPLSACVTVYTEPSGSAESEDCPAGHHTQRAAGHTHFLPPQKNCSFSGCGATLAAHVLSSGSTSTKESLVLQGPAVTLITTPLLGVVSCP